MPATIRTRDDRTAEEATTTTNKPSIDIQPLRDLARNFDIDIEPYLQEYLQHTNDLLDASSSDSSNVKSNFSQAALKIQNSAAIYNRKVDFLHQVVYEVFNDFIQAQLYSSKKKKRKSKGNGGGDVDIETFHEYDPDLQFLLLDDVLPTDRTEGNRKINLREVAVNDNSADMTMMNLDNTMATNVLGMGNNNNRTPTNNDVTLLSLGGVMSATRMMDQNGTFMITRQSLGQSSPTALSRMLMANLQGGPNGTVGDGNLRLLAGMCDVGSDGALLMPGTRTSVFINGEAAMGGGAGGGGENENGTIEIFPGGLSPGPDDVDRNNSFGVADHDNDDGGASFGNNDNDVFGDDNDNGVGFELNDNYAPEEQENEDDIETPKVLNFDQTKQPPKKKKVVEDPWAVLDPHEPSKDKAQPLRIGVTYRLPPGLDDEDRPSVSVTGSRTRTKATAKKTASSARYSNDDFNQPPFLADVTFDEGDDNAEDRDVSFQVETGVHVSLLKSNELIFGDEFAYVAKAHAKHKDAVKRQRRRQQQQHDDGPEADPYRDNHCNDYDDENDYGGGGFDFDDGDDESFGGGDNETRPAANRSNVDFTAIDDVFASSGFNENAYNDDDEFGDSSQQTFEDLCRAHLRKFAKSAEMYAKETQLTKRVGAWQTGLAPLLEEQDERPAFDIHDVGRDILDTMESTLTNVRKRTSTGEKKVDKLSSQKNRVGFSAIFAKDCEDYEVCRVFLSTLMLCNCGNIAIHNGGDGERLAKDLQVELLDAMFQPPMETYLAPSEQVLVTDDKDKEN
ncbi:condensin-2 complex subunit H2 [Skeletonema marinoi]|uniref:Condensin-2 complex subunit H2 n=1 Tax=Skeletonema marinoi TaxID=267567 RepID=A0AAD9DHJ2_9STRA|nr:condensin-2 complex subunit H2 [Skeletonema marinoi]